VVRECARMCTLAGRLGREPASELVDVTTSGCSVTGFDGPAGFETNQ